MYKFPVSLILASIVFSFAIIWWQTPILTHSSKFKVVCTTTFLADAVCHITGDHIELTCLMQPGIDPHTYKATEHDAIILSSADLIIYHGQHLEGKMAELLKSLNMHRPTSAACDALTQTDLRATDIAGIYDPHIWFDINLWIKVVDHLAKILATHDPAHKEQYLMNAQRYVKQLKELNLELTSKLATIPKNNRILVTAHDAFGYFGAAYDFTVIGLQGISTDSDISAYHVDKIADYIAHHNIPVIFAEMSIPHKSVTALQQAVARHGKKVILGPELYTDSLGNIQSPASTYDAFMRYTVDMLVPALS